MYMDETIAAICTPLGEGGLAVIRISGREALGVADRCFRPGAAAGILPSLAPSHTVHYGHVMRDGHVVDEVLLTVMHAPRTFTREDVVEIGCHGGVLASRNVLGAVLGCGARLAQAGEFTRRAFLNGRLDLTQAEAVAEVIHARTDLELAAAQEQLAGKLSAKIGLLRDDLLGVLAHVEAHIDFPDEDITPDTREGLMERLETGLGTIETLQRAGTEGQVLRRGIRAAILGKPNVGKSSLLNQLLGADRAIVSPMAGTTRDTIQETASIRGLPVVVIDTAGLREAGDAVEAEGVRRSHAAIAQADLLLIVIDGSKPLEDADEALLRLHGDRKRIVVVNKSDLGTVAVLPEMAGVPKVEVSSLKGDGIEALRDAIAETVRGGGIQGEMWEAMINARHMDALRRAHEGGTRALDSLRADRTLELVALDLRMAVQAVGEIVGKTATEDMLDALFGQFCIGK